MNKQILLKKYLCAFLSISMVYGSSYPYLLNVSSIAYAEDQPDKKGDLFESGLFNFFQSELNESLVQHQTALQNLATQKYSPEDNQNSNTLFEFEAILSSDYLFVQTNEQSEIVVIKNETTEKAVVVDWEDKQSFSALKSSIESIKDQGYYDLLFDKQDVISDKYQWLYIEDAQIGFIFEIKTGRLFAEFGTGDLSKDNQEWSVIHYVDTENQEPTSGLDFYSKFRTKNLSFSVSNPEQGYLTSIQHRNSLDWIDPVSISADSASDFVAQSSGDAQQIVGDIHRALNLSLCEGGCAGTVSYVEKRTQSYGGTYETISYFDPTTNILVKSDEYRYGRLAKTEIYLDGAVKNIVLWSVNGTISTFSEFNENGDRTLFRRYQNGKITLEKEYFSSGVLEFKRGFDSDGILDVEMRYSESGNLISKVFFWPEFENRDLLNQSKFNVVIDPKISRSTKTQKIYEALKTEVESIRLAFMSQEASINDVVGAIRELIQSGALPELSMGESAAQTITDHQYLLYEIQKALSQVASQMNEIIKSINQSNDIRLVQIAVKTLKDLNARIQKQEMIGFYQGVTQDIYNLYGAYTETEAPTIQITSHQHLEKVKGLILISGEATDNTRVTRVEFTLDGNIIGVDEDGSDGWSLEWDSREGPIGDHILGMQAFDMANNMAAAASEITIYTHDIAGPLIELTDAPTPNQLVAGNSSHLIRVKTTDVSGLKVPQFYLNGILLGDGIYNGGSSASEKFYYRYVQIPSTHGNFDIKVVSSDSFNNLSEAIVSVYVDKEPPIAVFISPAADSTQKNSVDFAIDATDDRAVQKVEFYDGGKLLGSDLDGSDGWSSILDLLYGDNGSRSIVAKVFDEAGNVAEVIHQVDVQNDMQILLSGSQDAVEGSRTISAFVPDKVGLLKVEFSVNDVIIGNGIYNSGSDIYRVTWNSNNSNLGEASIKSVAHYASKSPQESSLKTTVVDTIAPTAIFVFPNYDNANIQGIFDLKINPYDLRGIQSVDFYYNDTLIGSDISSEDDWKISWDARFITPGSYTLKAVVKDLANNEKSIVRPVTVSGDTVAPVISNVTPAHYARVKGNVQFDVDATDAFGVTKVEFQYGSNLFFTDEDGSDGWGALWDSTQASLGVNYVVVTAYDAAGKSSSYYRYVNVYTHDLEPPTLSEFIPAEGEELTGIIHLEVEAVDSVSVGSVKFYLGDQFIGSGRRVSGSWTKYYLDWDISKYGNNGENVIRAVAEDSSQNRSELTRRLFTDKEPPTASFIQPTLDQEVQKSVTVSINAADNSGIEKVEFYDADRGRYYPAQFVEVDSDGSNGWQANLDMLYGSNGSRTITAKVYDVSGNTFLITQQVDVQNPPISFMRIEDGQEFDIQTISLNAFSVGLSAQKASFYFKDQLIGAQDGISNTGHFINWNPKTYPLGEGILKVTILGYDGTVYQDEVSIILGDKTPPSGVFYFPSQENQNITNSSGNLVVSANDNKQVQRVEYYLDDVRVGNGNLATSGTWINQWVMNYDSRNLPNGSHVMTAKIYDTSNNLREITRSVVINNPDTNPPSASFVEPSTGSTVNDTVNISVSANDAEGPVTKILFQYRNPQGQLIAIGEDVDGSDGWSLDWVTNSLIDGSYQLSATATDYKNNSREITLNNVNVDNRDKIKPTGSFKNLFGGSSVEGIVKLEADAADDQGVGRVEFYIGNNQLGSDDDSRDGFSIDWDTATLSNGLIELKIKIYDLAGNVTEVELEVSIENPDTIRPIVYFSYPSQYQLINGDYPVAVSASDNEGVSRVEFYSDDVKFETITESSSDNLWRVVWDTSGVEKGMHALKVRVYDASGNYAETTRMIQFDRDADLTNPSVDLLTPPSRESVSGIVRLEANATDNIGVSRVDFYINDELVGRDTDSSDGFGVDWDSANQLGGLKAVMVRAFDEAGNNSIFHRQFYVDYEQGSFFSLINTFQAQIMGDIEPTNRLIEFKQVDDQLRITGLGSTHTVYSDGTGWQDVPIDEQVGGFNYKKYSLVTPSGNTVNVYISDASVQKIRVVTTGDVTGGTAQDIVEYEWLGQFAQDGKRNYYVTRTNASQNVLQFSDRRFIYDLDTRYEYQRQDIDGRVIYVKSEQNRVSHVNTQFFDGRQEEAFTHESTYYRFDDQGVKIGELYKRKLVDAEGSLSTNASEPIEIRYWFNELDGEQALRIENKGNSTISPLLTIWDQVNAYSDMNLLDRISLTRRVNKDAGGLEVWKNMNAGLDIRFEKIYSSTNSFIGTILDDFDFPAQPTALKVKAADGSDSPYRLSLATTFQDGSFCIWECGPSGNVNPQDFALVFFDSTSTVNESGIQTYMKKFALPLAEDVIVEIGGKTYLVATETVNQVSVNAQLIPYGLTAQELLFDEMMSSYQATVTKTSNSSDSTIAHVALKRDLDQVYVAEFDYQITATGFKLIRESVRPYGVENAFQDQQYYYRIYEQVVHANYPDYSFVGDIAERLSGFIVQEENGENIVYADFKKPYSDEYQRFRAVPKEDDSPAIVFWSRQADQTMGWNHTVNPTKKPNIDIRLTTDPAKVKWMAGASVYTAVNTGIEGEVVTSDVINGESTVIPWDIIAQGGPIYKFESTGFFYIQSDQASPIGGYNDDDVVAALNVSSNMQKTWYIVTNSNGIPTKVVEMTHFSDTRTLLQVYQYENTTSKGGLIIEFDFNPTNGYESGWKREWLYDGRLRISASGDSYVDYTHYRQDRMAYVQLTNRMDGKITVKYYVQGEGTLINQDVDYLQVQNMLDGPGFGSAAFIPDLMALVDENNDPDPYVPIIPWTSNDSLNTHNSVSVENLHLPVIEIVDPNGFVKDIPNSAYTPDKLNVENNQNLKFRWIDNVPYLDYQPNVISDLTLVERLVKVIGIRRGTARNTGPTQSMMDYAPPEVLAQAGIKRYTFLYEYEPNHTRDMDVIFNAQNEMIWLGYTVSNVYFQGVEKTLTESRYHSYEFYPKGYLGNERALIKRHSVSGSTKPTDDQSYVQSDSYTTTRQIGYIKKDDEFEISFINTKVVYIGRALSSILTIWDPESSSTNVNEKSMYLHLDDLGQQVTSIYNQDLLDSLKLPDHLQSQATQAWIKIEKLLTEHDWDAYLAAYADYKSFYNTLYYEYYGRQP